MSADKKKDRYNAYDDESLLLWPGLMGDASTGLRVAIIVLLGVATCAMVATQTSYFVIGNTHVMAVLAPISACALLFGPLPAIFVGALAGLTELLHALFMPLDAYELYFTLPLNSMILFGVIGHALGIMYAFASHRWGKKGWKRILAVVVICLLGSLLFTFVFVVFARAINMLASFEIPQEIIDDLSVSGELASQVAANFLIMLIVSILAVCLSHWRHERVEETPLRETFQIWLFVVVAGAYMVTMAFGYMGISTACRRGSDSELLSQTNYLSRQLTESDRLLEKIADDGHLSAMDARDIHASFVSSITNGLPIPEGGVAAVAEDNIIVSSNVDSLVGRRFDEVVGSGISKGFDEELYNQHHSIEWFLNESNLTFFHTSETYYLRIARTGDYQMLMAVPASEVFSWRPYLMMAASIVFFVLFVLVFAQASLLLKNVVVRGFDETNQTLALITDGDLEQSVDVRDSREFTSLSTGINSMVSALKDAIAAEGARIERDLTTAKAIQESALPTTFPPFPDIREFDIFASMNAAREVGGDFYDFFLVDDHTLGFLIADVSGKGIPASLFMMAAKAELANYISSGMSLADAVQSANWHLCQGNEASMFVTVWAATLDYHTGLLTYVNAGHNFPLVRHGGKWEWLRTKGGLFLGNFETAKYRSATLQLEPSDQIFLYTDGVNEAFNEDDETYGDKRLEDFLGSHANLHPRALVDALGADLRAWAGEAEQSDDITMLSLEFGVPPEVTGTLTIPAELDNLEKVLDFIHEELARRLCPISAQNQLDIAMEELYVNICNYAYGDGTGDCRVDYVYNTNPNSITVSLADWGAPFDPLRKEDPEKPSSIQEAKIGGLGIFLAKNLTEDITYLRDGDMNVISFRKSW